MNKLLERQIQKYMESLGQVPENLSKLFGVISESYDHYEKDRKMMERSIELSSIEMIELNSELRREKKDLKKVHKDLKGLFEDIDEVFYTVDMISFELLQISAACEKIYGYTSEEFMNDPNLWQKVIHPEDKHLAVQYTHSISQGKQVKQQYRIIHKDERVRWIENKIIPSINERGQVIRTDGVTSDISERKLAEKELDRSFSILEATIESTADGILVADFNGNIQRFNKKFSELWSLPQEVLESGNDEEALSYVLNQLLNPEEFLNKVKDLYLQKEARSFDILNFKDGRVVERYSQPQLINEECVGRVWSFRDISARKKAEENIKESELRYRSLVEQATDAICIADGSLKITEINTSACQAFGYSKEEFLKLSLLDLLFLEEVRLDPIKIDDLKSGKTIRNERRAKRKDGSSFDVELISKMLQDGRILLFGRDITERKKTEAKLNKSEKRYRQIVETAQEGIWMIDENNLTTFVNKKMCELIEYLPEEIIGKNIDFFMNKHASSLVAKQIEKRMRGINGSFSFKFITKSGRIVWTSLSTNAIFDEAGKYQGSLAMVTDITQRKHDEELIKQSQTKLLINNVELEQKNKELEQFAFIASHDLQEPLRTISSFVELLQNQYKGKLDETADQYLVYTRQASERMRTLISDLLKHSRIGAQKELKQVDTDLLLKEVLQDMRAAITESGAEISFNSLPIINGYSTEIKQLFQNLISNAIKFRKKDIPPQIRILAEKENSSWKFSFSDNGIGIDPRHNEKIFAIFQRLHTRKVYDGSGIGLSNCKKIVELHNGKIWVDSNPGIGSSFILILPILSNEIHTTK